MEDIFEKQLHVYSMLQQQIIDIYKKKFQNIEDEIEFCKTYNYPYYRYENQKKTCLKYINDAKSRLEKQ